MLVIGLTGGIGSGKSTVSALLAERGAVVVLAGMEAPPNFGPEYATAFRQAFPAGRLVVVSNREPYPHARDAAGAISVERPAGGLALALDPVLRALGGSWVAWGHGDADREVVDEHDRVVAGLARPRETAGGGSGARAGVARAWSAITQAPGASRSGSARASQAASAALRPASPVPMSVCASAPGAGRRARAAGSVRRMSPRIRWAASGMQAGCAASRRSNTKISRSGSNSRRWS